MDSGADQLRRYPLWKGLWLPLVQRPLLRHRDDDPDPARPFPADRETIDPSRKRREEPVLPLAGGRVPPARSLSAVAERVEVWSHAISAFLEHPSAGKLFELLADGQVVEWEVRDL